MEAKGGKGKGEGGGVVREEGTGVKEGGGVEAREV